jgi:hypothetical protein
MGRTSRFYRQSLFPPESLQDGTVFHRLAGVLIENVLIAGEVLSVGQPCEGDGHD